MTVDIKINELQRKGGKMEDSLIIDMLFERNERALEQIDVKYSRLYLSIIREMLWDENDVSECANDCLLAVWNSIPPNRPDNLPSYICKIARRLGINRYRYNTRQKRSDGYTAMLSELEDCIPDRTETGFGDNDIPPEKFSRLLEEFISSLDAETRVLFVRRYVYFESVASLSDRFQMRENLVAVKLYRAKQRLKKFLEKEGIYI
ncbi:MAG: sigma-70 family RNA polymerase sigma factor [Ruminococcaceae bacterium]|nr:sigma-70 family RNA polymerase sigma factor [Oscillospiraceae bacterium]